MPPAILARAAAALAPRAQATEGAMEQHEALLESYRGFVVASAVMAIASAWDSGRLAFPTPGQLPFQAEVFGLAGRRADLAEPQLAEAIAALNQATTAMRTAHAALAGQPSPYEVFCHEHGLTGAGALVLLLVAAPALWGERRQ